MQMLLALITFSMLYSLNAEDKNDQDGEATEWCWTIPDFNVKPEPLKFGYNFGLCQSSESSEAPLVKQKVTVKMPDIDGFGGEIGPFKMRFVSNDIDGEWFTLNEGTFEKDENFELKIQVPSVGEISSVDIQMEQNDKGKFYCETIKVEDGPKNYEFQCQGILEKDNKQMILEKQNMVEWEITMYAVDDEKLQTDDPIFVSLQGSKVTSQFILFAAGGVQAEPVQESLEFPEIGEFQCVHFKSFSNDPLKPTKITLQKDGGPIQEFENEDDSEIHCPQSCVMTFCKGAQSTDEPEPPAPDVDDDVSPTGVDDSEDIDPPTVPSSPFQETFLYNCAKLSAEEKDDLQKIGCKTTGTILFENQNYFSSNINYEQKIVNCPAHCNEDAIVLGRGIHNPESTICAAAIADGSMPKMGGCVAVSRISGQTSYPKSKISNGIKINQGGASKWSFTTKKVDNVDFAKSDIRILNDKGEPDYQGRLEFRVGGKWGTVSTKGSEDSAARWICKTLNYLDGEFLNNEEKDFCANYQGKDHCGYKGQFIHYQGYKCDGEVSALSECYREIATENNHKDDIIISCSMVDKSQTKNVQPDELQPRIVGETGAPSQDGIGRLEVFYQDKWGGVCNSNFDDNSANVVCKQLGYASGKTIGEPGKFNACKYGKQDYCEENSEMVLDSVKCLGSEQKVSDCGGVKNPKCSHEQAVMVKCEGGDSPDPSGQTQPNDEPEPEPQRPNFGNLPLANPYKIACDTKLSTEDFFGDPGSIYLVTCPEDCQHNDAKIAGTGIYTYDSSICKAGIHSGVIQSKGGSFTVQVTYGQTQYYPSLNREVYSVKNGYSKRSFVVSQDISLHKAWALYDYNAPYVGLLAPHNNDHIEPDLDDSPTSFVQMQGKTVRNQIKNVAKNFRKFVQKRSMLQLKQSQLNKIFEWVAPKNFKFTADDKPDFTHLEKDDSLAKLENFSILTEFQVDENNGISEIFGHSECECWGLLFTPDGLEFGPKCKDNMVKLGFQVAQSKKYHVGLSYDYEAQKLIFVVGDKIIYQDKEAMQFHCADKINIGYNQFSNSKHLVGKISYVSVYPDAMTAQQLIKLTTGPIPSQKKDTSDVSQSSEVVLQKTQDNRKCISPCVSDPFPEQPNSPDPPALAELGKAPGGDSSEGIPDSSAPSANDDDDEEDDDEAEKGLNPDAHDLLCDDTFMDDKFKGEVFKEIVVFCPKGCSKNDEVVIGTQIYHKSSSVCKAAIHDGVIKDEDGGEFVVVLVNPVNHFYGGQLNKVVSLELQVQEPEISYSVKRSKKIYNLKCDTQGNDSMFEDVLGAIQAKCPPGCSEIAIRSYGDDEYADISYVCQSAIHSGASSDNGGVFQMTFVPSVSFYQSSRENMIESSKYDNSKKEIQKSMKFLVNKANACGFFKEDYENEVVDDWEIKDMKGTKDGPSQWSFVQSPKNPKKKVLAQLSDIELENSPKYSTQVIHKQFDCSNGLLKVNVYQQKKSQFGIYVRYYDENNYYLFKFNTPQEDPIILVKKVAGIEKVLESYDNQLIEQDFARMYIVFDNQRISLNMQSGNYRNIPKVIDVLDDSIQKGKIGFATNGDNDVVFDGIEVTTYNILTGIVDNKSLNQRIWDDCLKPASLSYRERYCKQKNGNEKWAIPICKKLLNYCEYCCATKIPKWEKIIFYNCQKTCVVATRVHEKKLRSDDDDEIEVYTPKKGDKIDLLNVKSKAFLPATVTQVDKEKDTGDLQVQVSFLVANGQYMKETVKFPDPKQRIQKCGKVLKGRDDCV